MKVEGKKVTIESIFFTQINLRNFMKKKILNRFYLAKCKNKKSQNQGHVERSRSEIMTHSISLTY